MKNKLVKLQSRIHQARDAMRQELKKQFPENSRVGVYLNRFQRYPSPGDVLAVCGEGYVHVLLLTKNRRGYRTVKRVYWTKVTSEVSP